eukprot:541209_1
MTSGFFALYLMITWMSAGDDDCDGYPCPTCWTSNTKSNCATGEFEYCRNSQEYCDDAPTRYHITVTGAIGYYSTWVESGPNDVQMENGKPIYKMENVIDEEGFYIWWTDYDNKWILDRNVGVSESISECDELNLFNCPWFDLCVTTNGLASGYYLPQEAERYTSFTPRYYRNVAEYKFVISYTKLLKRWALSKYKLDSGRFLAYARFCYEDNIFDCGWVTQYDSELDICKN